MSQIYSSMPHTSFNLLAMLMNDDPLQYPFDVSVYAMLNSTDPWMCIVGGKEQNLHPQRFWNGPCWYHPNTSNTDHIWICCHSILNLSFITPSRSKSRIATPDVSTSTGDFKLANTPCQFEKFEKSNTPCQFEKFEKSLLFPVPLVLPRMKLGQKLSTLQ